MEARDRHIENLERILRELMEIHALTLDARACKFRMWLDLAIKETRRQITRIHTETAH